MTTLADHKALIARISQVLLDFQWDDAKIEQLAAGLADALAAPQPDREELAEGREHLTVSGTFQSDKYPWCPPGYLPLKITDPLATDLLYTYATRRKSIDGELPEAAPQPDAVTEGLAKATRKVLDDYRVIYTGEVCDAGGGLVRLDLLHALRRVLDWVRETHHGQPSGPEGEPKCPHCGDLLHHCRWQPDAPSMLNRDQWESIRAGDWYCDSAKDHPQEHRRGSKNSYAYYWNNELAGSEGEPLREAATDVVEFFVVDDNGCQFCREHPFSLDPKPCRICTLAAALALSLDSAAFTLEHKGQPLQEAAEALVKDAMHQELSGEVYCFAGRPGTFHRAGTKPGCLICALREALSEVRELMAALAEEKGE